MAVLFAFFSIGALLLRWLKLEYRVGADEIRIDSGWLSRTSRAIPFDRVTDVDLEQGPIHRLFGLARVKLETGASAGGKEEEGVLHTISLERAEALREHIRARRGLAAAPAANRGDGRGTSALFAMDSRRVLTAGLFNFSLAVIAGLFGVTQTMGDALGLRSVRAQLLARPAGRGRAAAVTDPDAPDRRGHRRHRPADLCSASAPGWSAPSLREHGFRLDRTETGFRRRRGLLTLTDVTIPAKRVQAAILANGPIRRRFGWWVLKLQSLAQDGGKGDHVVAPLAREEEAAEILASFGWPIGADGG